MSKILAVLGVLCSAYTVAAFSMTRTNPLPYGEVRNRMVSLSNDVFIHVSTDRYVRRSVDGGKTWVQLLRLSQDFTVHCVARTTNKVFVVGMNSFGETIAVHGTITGDPPTLGTWVAMSRNPFAFLSYAWCQSGTKVTISGGVDGYHERAVQNNPSWVQTLPAVAVDLPLAQREYEDVVYYASRVHAGSTDASVPRITKFNKTSNTWTTATVTAISNKFGNSYGMGFIVVDSVVRLMVAGGSGGTGKCCTYLRCSCIATYDINTFEQLSLLPNGLDSTESIYCSGFNVPGTVSWKCFGADSPQPVQLDSGKIVILATHTRFVRDYYLSGVFGHGSQYSDDGGQTWASWTYEHYSQQASASTYRTYSVGGVSYRARIGGVHNQYNGDQNYPYSAFYPHITITTNGGTGISYNVRSLLSGPTGYSWVAPFVTILAVGGHPTIIAGGGIFVRDNALTRYSSHWLASYVCSHIVSVRADGSATPTYVRATPFPAVLASSKASMLTSAVAVSQSVLFTYGNDLWIVQEWNAPVTQTASRNVIVINDDASFDTRSNFLPVASYGHSYVETADGTTALLVSPRSDVATPSTSGARRLSGGTWTTLPMPYDRWFGSLVYRDLDWTGSGHDTCMFFGSASNGDVDVQDGIDAPYVGCTSNMGTDWSWSTARPSVYPATSGNALHVAAVGSPTQLLAARAVANVRESLDVNFPTQAVFIGEYTGVQGRWFSPVSPVVGSITTGSTSTGAQRVARGDELWIIGGAEAMATGTHTFNPGGAIVSLSRSPRVFYSANTGSSWSECVPLSDGIRHGYGSSYVGVYDGADNVPYIHGGVMATTTEGSGSLRVIPDCLTGAVTISTSQPSVGHTTVSRGGCVYSVGGVSSWGIHPASTSSSGRSGLGYACGDLSTWTYIPDSALPPELRSNNFFPVVFVNDTALVIIGGVYTDTSVSPTTNLTSCFVPLQSGVPQGLGIVCTRITVDGVADVDVQTAFTRAGMLSYRTGDGVTIFGGVPTSVESQYTQMSVGLYSRDGSVWEFIRSDITSAFGVVDTTPVDVVAFASVTASVPPTTINRNTFLASPCPGRKTRNAANTLVSGSSAYGFFRCDDECPYNTYGGLLRTQSCVTCTEGYTPFNASVVSSQCTACEQWHLPNVEEYGCSVFEPGTLSITSTSSLMPNTVPLFDSSASVSDMHVYRTPGYLWAAFTRVCINRSPVVHTDPVTPLRVRVTFDAGGVYVRSSADIEYSVSVDGVSSASFASGSSSVSASGPLTTAYVIWHNSYTDACFDVGYKTWADIAAQDVHQEDVFDVHVAVVSEGASVSLWDMKKTLRFVRVANPVQSVSLVSVPDIVSVVGDNVVTIGETMESSGGDPSFVVAFERACLEGTVSGTHAYVPDQQILLTAVHDTVPAGLPFVGSYVPSIRYVSGTVPPQFVAGGNGDTLSAAVESAIGNHTTGYRIVVPFSGSSCGAASRTFVRFGWFDTQPSSFRISGSTVSDFGHDTTDQSVYGETYLRSVLSIPLTSGVVQYPIEIRDPSGPIDFYEKRSAEFRVRFSEVSFSGGNATFTVQVPLYGESYTGPRVWYGVSVSESCMDSRNGDYFSWRAGQTGMCSNYDATTPPWSVPYSGQLSPWYTTRPVVSRVPSPSAPTPVQPDTYEYAQYTFSAPISDFMNCLDDDAARAVTIENGATHLLVNIPVTITAIRYDNTSHTATEAACFSHVHRVSVNSTFRLFSDNDALRTMSTVVERVSLDHGSQSDCAARPAITVLVPPTDANGHITMQGSSDEHSVCNAQEDGTVARVQLVMRVDIPYGDGLPHRGLLPPTSMGKNVDGTWNAAIRPNPLNAYNCYGFNATLHSTALSVRFVGQNTDLGVNQFRVTLATAYLPFKHHTSGDILTTLLRDCKTTTGQLQTSLSLLVPLYETQSGTWQQGLSTHTPSMYSGPMNDILTVDLSMVLDPSVLSPASVVDPQFQSRIYKVPNTGPVGLVTDSLTLAPGDSTGIVIESTVPALVNFSRLIIERAVAVATRISTMPEGLFTHDCSVDTTVLHAITADVESRGYTVDVVTFVDGFRRVDRWPETSSTSRFLQTQRCIADQVPGGAIEGDDTFLCSDARCDSLDPIFDIGIPTRMRDGVILPGKGIRSETEVAYCVYARTFVCASDHRGAGRRLLSLRPARALLTTSGSGDAESIHDYNAVFTASMGNDTDSTELGGTDDTASSDSSGGVAWWVWVASASGIAVAAVAVAVVMALSRGPPRGVPRAPGRYSELTRPRSSVM